MLSLSSLLDLDGVGEDFKAHLGDPLLASATH